MSSLGEVRAMLVGVAYELGPRTAVIPRTAEIDEATDLINMAVKQLPASEESRYAEEWLSTLHSLPDRRARRDYALSLLFHISEIERAIAETALEGEAEFE